MIKHISALPSGACLSAEYKAIVGKLKQYLMLHLEVTAESEKEVVKSPKMP